MRNLMIALAAVSAFGITATNSSPAKAREYPYCMQGKDAGFPGDCPISQRCRMQGIGIG
jgi:Protein of unknown function (DUF3551)